jgi:hypothetical protein
MRKWRNDFKTSNNSDTWYDLFDDWDLIASSLKTQYGYSIRKEIDNLSWGELCSDIAGLNGNTPLGNIVRIRSENNPEILKNFSPDELRIRSEWRNKNASQMSKETYEQSMNSIKEMFIAMSKEGSG